MIHDSVLLFRGCILLAAPMSERSRGFANAARLACHRGTPLTYLLSARHDDREKGKSRVGVSPAAERLKNGPAEV